MNYTVHQANSDSVSIANDYFEKPATLIVQKGKQYIEFSVKQSEWVQYIKVSHGETSIDVKTISEDHENNTRTVAFALDADMNEPIMMQMHILIESMEPKYDHRYSVRMLLDSDSLERIGVVPSSYADEASEEERSSGYVIFGYVLAALVLFALVVIVLKVRSSKNKKQ